MYLLWNNSVTGIKLILLIVSNFEGGPGMPSTGYGNFIEIGPLDLNLKPRNHTWTKHFNVLFIDNPVGVGFSYIDNNQTYLAKTTEEVGKDLVVFLESFLKTNKEFETVPLYIFGESYGGKMTVEFAHQLTKVIIILLFKLSFLIIYVACARLTY